MKNTFYEHHVEYVNKSEIIEKGTIFLDANALLNLYRLSNENREKLFEILDNVKERLYLSNQVGKEFYKNRTKVMYMKQNLKSGLIQELSKDIDSIFNKVKNVNFTSKYKDGCNLLKHEHALKNALVNKLKDMKKDIVDTIESYDISIDNDTYLDEDKVLNRIVELFDGKVIEAMSEEELNKIYEEGKDRYDKKIPPGYEDIKEKDEPECYGDLVIWNELIEFAKEKKSNILFVSDDRKEDWCKLVTKFGQDDKKSKKVDFGTRPDLIKEFKEKTEQLFYSITTEDFIRKISELCKIDDTKELEAESGIIREELQSRKLIRNGIEHIYNLDIPENMLDKYTEYDEENKVQAISHDDLDQNEIINNFEFKERNKMLKKLENQSSIWEQLEKRNKMFKKLENQNNIWEQLEKRNKMLKKLENQNNMWEQLEKRNKMLKKLENQSSIWEQFEKQNKMLKKLENLSLQQEETDQNDDEE